MGTSAKLRSRPFACPICLKVRCQRLHIFFFRRPLLIQHEQAPLRVAAVIPACQIVVEFGRQNFVAVGKDVGRAQHLALFDDGGKHVQSRTGVGEDSHDISGCLSALRGAKLSPAILAREHGRRVQFEIDTGTLLEGLGDCIQRLFEPVWLTFKNGDAGQHEEWRVQVPRRTRFVQIRQVLTLSSPAAEMETGCRSSPSYLVSQVEQSPNASQLHGAPDSPETIPEPTPKLFALLKITGRTAIGNIFHFPKPNRKRTGLSILIWKDEY